MNDVGSPLLIGGGAMLANGRTKALNANIRIKAMNEDANDLGQSEEEILAYEVSDEAIEAAAVAGPTPTFWTSSCYAACCQK